MTVGHHLARTELDMLRLLFGDGGHVEAVDVVPVGEISVLLKVIIHASNVETGSVREHQTPGLEELVSSDDDVLQRGLVEETFSKPIRDYHVHLSYSIRKNEILNFAPDDVDFPSHVVLLDDFLGDLWIELKESRLSWRHLDIDKSCIGRKGGHSECG